MIGTVTAEDRARAAKWRGRPTWHRSPASWAKRRIGERRRRTRWRRAWGACHRERIRRARIHWDKRWGDPWRSGAREACLYCRPGDGRALTCPVHAEIPF